MGHCDDFPTTQFNDRQGAAGVFTKYNSSLRYVVVSCILPPLGLVVPSVAPAIRKPY